MTFSTPAHSRFGWSRVFLMMATEFLVAESSNFDSILTWLISRETIVNNQSLSGKA
ncbi:hypothetical protein C0J52_20723 [Blattella germanica]|nr:hypothetical protein C0J52_20723 [Blattella germanica]